MVSKKWLLLPCTLFLIACGGGRNGNGNGNENETLRYENGKGEATMEQLVLPDTCYASAEAVKYVVENTDSLPHPLKDFNDLFCRHLRVVAEIGVTPRATEITSAETDKNSRNAAMASLAL